MAQSAECISLSDFSADASGRAVLYIIMYSIHSMARGLGNSEIVESNQFNDELENHKLADTDCVERSLTALVNG